MTCTHVPGPFSSHFFRTKPTFPLLSEHHRVFANITFKINASFAKEVAFVMSRRGGNASGDRQNLLGMSLNKAQPPPTSYFRGIISPVPWGVLPCESGCPHDNRWIWMQTTGGKKSGLAPLTTSSIKFILTEMFISGTNSQERALLFLAFLANSLWIAKQDAQHLYTVILSSQLCVDYFICFIWHQDWNKTK